MENKFEQEIVDLFDLDDYQQQATETKNENGTVQERLCNWAMGLSGETGEFVDLLKKNLFHDHIVKEEKMIDELGDVLWYVAIMAEELDLSLKRVARYNIKKLSDRYEDGFSKKESKNRGDS